MGNGESNSNTMAKGIDTLSGGRLASPLLLAGGLECESAVLLGSLVSIESVVVLLLAPADVERLSLPVEEIFKASVPPDRFKDCGMMCN